MKTTNESTCVYPEFSVGAMLPNVGLYSSDEISNDLDISKLLASDDFEFDKLLDDDYSKYEYVTGRSELPDDAFGIPELRKYPLHKKKYVISAIKLFSRAPKDPEIRKQLAHRIYNRMRDYNMSLDDYVGENNIMRTYLKESEDINWMDSTFDVIFNEFFGETKESDDNDGRIKSTKIPDDIRAVVDILQQKGYRVDKASPGYSDTRFKNDRNKDGIINGKMVSTAKVTFEKDYKFPNTPKGWYWKVLPSNGFKALYVKPYTYDPKGKNADDAIEKWRNFYIKSLKEWAEGLPTMGNENVDKFLNKNPEEEDRNFKSTPDNQLTVKENADYLDDYLMMEGANIEYHKAIKETRKKFKEAMKSYKANMKAGKYGYAKTDLKKARDAVEHSMAILKSVKGDVGSFLFGLFVPTIKDVVFTLIMSAVMLPGTLSLMLKPAMSLSYSAFTGTTFVYNPNISGSVAYAAGAAAAWVMQLYRCLKDILTVANDVKDQLKAGKEITVDQFNGYRVSILRECNDLLKKIDRLEAVREKIEKDANEKAKEKLNKSIKESMEDNTMGYTDNIFTLEDAMNYISDYLSEAVDNAVSVEDSETKKAGPEFEGVTLKDNMDYIENYLKEANETEETRVGGDRNSSMKGTYGFIGSAERYKANSDSRHPQLKTAPWDAELAANLRGNAAMASKTLATADPFGSAKAVSEQVDSLRLSVYEAFDNGIIDEKTKTTFLEYLDLSNYE